MLYYYIVLDTGKKFKKSFPDNIVLVLDKGFMI